MSNLTLAKARLQIIEANKEQPKITATEAKGPKHTQQLLLTALETASKCVLILSQEEIRIHNLVKDVESRKDEDPHWETRVNYYLANLKVMQDTYPVFADEAKRRKEMLNTVNAKNRWGLEKERCTHDTQYWFDNYAWTADPRKTGVWALPFLLYDYQKEAIKWVEDLIFLEQTSGGIDKSRDLGLSWLLTALFYKHWQHPKDGAFNALMGSITSDECDKVGDPSSMFEKLRIQSRLQPLGLLPKGFHCEIPYMKCVNPENGSTITGETANGDFGRSGRYKVILFDEFSAFEQDTAAMTASSQSAPCKLYNSTARGHGNEFARLRHSGKVKWKTFHWTQHPHKSKWWYDYQNLEMNPVQVAQELDIDYNASQPNKVYGAYNETYHVITKSELMRALPEFRNPLNQQFRIPMTHKAMMGYDVGQSDEHANAMYWFLTLKKGTKTVDGVDLSGSVLIYRESIPSPHTTPRNIARIIKEKEGLYESKAIYDRVMSHEQTTMRDALEWDYGVTFRKWNSDYNAGIARVRDYLEIVAKHEPHPFREFTRRTYFPDASPIMGRPNMYLVTDDGQGELSYEPALERFIVKQAVDEGGMVRLRGEFPAYHYPVGELGKEARKMRPKKDFDDAMDVVRCVASECFAPINPLTDDERFENYLPDNLKSDNMEDIPLRERGMALLQREQERREFKQHEESKLMSYRDSLMHKLINAKR